MSSFVARKGMGASEISTSSHPLALDDASPDRRNGSSSKLEPAASTFTLRRDATRASSSAAIQNRPNYFDLQKLAAGQAEEAALDRERLGRLHRESMSVTQSVSHSVFSSSASTSSIASDDEMEQVEDESAVEDEEVPDWIGSTNGPMPTRRPPSRNSAFSTGASRSSQRESYGSQPQRSSGIASRNSMRSPPPGMSTFSTMMPPSRVNSPYNEMAAANSSNGYKKSSQQYLASLHLMTDDELDRQLGLPQGSIVRPTASPLQSFTATLSERSESTASRSRFSGMLSTSPRSESPQTERSMSNLLVPDVKAGYSEENTSQRHRHKLIREMSERIGGLVAATDTSRQALERERDQLLIALSAHKKEAEAREEALRDILISMGVSTARIDRALVQAATQSQVPVFRANERIADNIPTTSVLRSKAVKDPEQMLPDSLREAMLEGLIEAGSPSRHLNEVVLSPTDNASIKDQQSSHSASIDTQGQGSRLLSPTARSAWGSGLVPWSRNGPISKKASASVQATSPAAVEADGYFSDAPAPSHDTPSPSPHRGRRQTSRSSSISAVMSRAEQYNDADVDEEVEEAVRRTWADAASRGAFGLLGSLAWRRKKPEMDKVSRRKAVHDIPRIQTEPVSHDTEVMRKSRDDTSVHSSRNRHSSASSRKHKEDEGRIEEEVNEDTVRAKTVIARPQARYTLSGRDVISALYEAIGSAPVSPDLEKKQTFLTTSQLPKPNHFKSICLATRIMTTDPGSILVNKGKDASSLTRSLSFALVQRAREEGKTVEEHNDTIKKGRKSSIAGLSSARDDRDARAVPPVKSPFSNTNSTTATLNKTLGKYSKQASFMTEPNVTRLPNLFGFGNHGNNGQIRGSTTSKSLHAKSASLKKTKEEKDSMSNTPIVTELEPILAHDVKPPTFTLSARRSIYLPQPIPQKRRGTIDSLSRLSEGEESSGDEFEVYGGKHLQDDDDSSQLSKRQSGHEDHLLTDRYGFVYDATPADVRLLRRAKKESTHAPACLTGIRVGVRARGGSDSQSDEDKEDADVVEADSDLEITADSQEAALPQAVDDGGDRHDSDNASQKTVSSRKTAGTGEVIGSNSNVGLLSVKASKAVAQATSVSAASQTSSSPGPTCPKEEKLHFEGQQATAASDDIPSHRKPPSTSQTVKRLLGQLQEMHHTQQTSQQLEWDGFFQKRKATIREGKVEAADGNRKGGEGINKLAKTNTSTSAFTRYESNASSEEEWHLGGLVGLNRMGTESKDYQEFTRLLYKGIPLLYRPKVWYECSGAMELNEPGRYQELLAEHENEENQCTNQIDLDIGRTMPTNIYFSGDGPGVIKLRRLLVAFSWFNPKCGYCQGMNNLAATLLLTHATEEDAFWVLVSIIERILPEEYYTSHLLVSQADQRVLIDLMDTLLPQLSAHIRSLGVDLPAVTFAWFLSLYTDCLPVETLFRVWDVMFVEGMIVLFRVAIAIFIINEKQLLETSSPSAFYSFVHGMTSHLFSADRLIKLACEDLKNTVKKEMIIERREKHAKDLTVELGLDTSSV